MARMTFTEIESWAIPQTASVRSFFETIALVQKEGVWIRLSAKTQRALLGAVVFGKQEILVSDSGSVKVRRSACFGTDYEMSEYEAHKISYAIANSLQMSPGIYGPGMYNGIPETKEI